MEKLCSSDVITALYVVVSIFYVRLCLQLKCKQKNNAADTTIE